MATKTEVKNLFGLLPTSQRVKEYISFLSSLANAGNDDKVQVKAYPDAVFVNYYALGCSIEYRPTNGYKPPPNVQSIAELQTENLALDKIDIYSPTSDNEQAYTNSTSSKTSPTFAKYPNLPFTITFSHEPPTISVSADTTGKDFVAALGEPDRKGGGSGPSSGSIDIWCEWTKEGIMVEFGGRDARGPQAWDKGKDANWKNYSLSDNTDIDNMLALQGVGWATRLVIRNATITLHINHYKDPQGEEHIDIEQTLTGGITTSPELRTLDWTPREVDHSLFGSIIGKSRRIPVSEVTDEYLKNGWLPDVSRDGAIEAFAESDKAKNPHDWKLDMIWGFEEITKGERRHVRKIRFTGPKGEIITPRIVYDYVGTS